MSGMSESTKKARDIMLHSYQQMDRGRTAGGVPILKSYLFSYWHLVLLNDIVFTGSPSPMAHVQRVISALAVTQVAQSDAGQTGTTMICTRFYYTF